MKRIIALCGEKDKGKTTTLNKLCKDLLKATELKFSEKKYGNEEDRLYILNERKIAIATCGDNPNAIMIAVVLFIVSKSDLLIIAYRYNGENEFPKKTIKDNVIIELEKISNTNEKDFIKNLCRDEDTIYTISKIINGKEEEDKIIKNLIKEALVIKGTFEKADEEDFITYINVGNDSEYNEHNDHEEINKKRVERINKAINKH